MCVTVCVVMCVTVCVVMCVTSQFTDTLLSLRHSNRFVTECFKQHDTKIYFIVSRQAKVCFVAFLHLY